MQVVPGIVVGGKYQVEQPLARGGMGSVWVARHTKLGNPVAIKFLDAHLAAAPALVARFEREARAAANLDTPHVVHVHDYGVEEGTPYLVMELLRGEDLNTRVRKRERLTLGEAAKILSQMSRALRRAHEAGIVHRDLKPANVFLARVEDDEVVKILDFGIAKEKWSRVDDATKTGEVFGSPHYMSPEQARAQKDVDHRADLWATGVILYRMLTGRLPFPGEVLGEVLSSVLVDPVPLVAHVAPDLPAALDAFFSKALAKKKEERFSSIGEMVDAFTAIATAPGPPAPPAHAGPTAVTLDARDAPQVHHPRLTPSPAAALTAEAPPPTPLQAPRDATADASKTIDTAAPTKVYVRPDAPTEPLPASQEASHASSETTGPSIASSTSSLLPTDTSRRHSRAPWVVGGVALCSLAIGTWALSFGPATPDVGASGSAASPAASVATSLVIQTAKPEDSTPAPTSSPSSSAIIPPADVGSSPGASIEPSAPQPTSTASSSSRKAGTVKPSPAASTTAPRATATPKTSTQKLDEWGLPVTKEKR